MDKAGAMERVWFWVQFSLVALVAWWAGLHSAFRVLLVMQTLDVFTGILAASKNKSLRSRIGAAGITRKMAAWLLLGALGFIQGEVSTAFDWPETYGYGVAQWSAIGLAFMEFVSITENAARLGVPLPGWLRETLSETATRFGYVYGDRKTDAGSK